MTKRTVTAALNAEIDGLCARVGLLSAEIQRLREASAANTTDLLGVIETTDKAYFHLRTRLAAQAEVIASARRLQSAHAAGEALDRHEMPLNSIYLRELEAALRRLDALPGGSE